MARQDATFWGLWLFIGLVSALDLYLALRSYSILDHVERNPLVRWIVSSRSDNPNLLITAKFVGTILALWLLALLHSRSAKLGVVVASVVAVFQGFVLAFNLSG